MITAALAASMLLATPAHAAPDAIEVTNNLTCATDGTAEPGSLMAALEAVNASANPDGAQITFAAGLGAISYANGSCAMSTDRVGNPGNDQDPGLSGARLVIDAAGPVSIDFTNMPEITTTGDWDYAGILVKSDNVELRNLGNMKAGAAGIAVSGQNVLIDNVNFIDTSSIIAEMGVAILNGASDVTIRHSVIESQWFSGIIIDGSHNTANAGSVSNIVIDRVTFRGNAGSWGHIGVEDNVTVHGLSVVASDFDSSTRTVLMNPGVTVGDFVFQGNTVEVAAGQAGQDVIGFIGTGQTMTNVALTVNDFIGIGNGSAGADAGNLGFIVEPNFADWTGLTVAHNRVDESRGLVFHGTVSHVVISENEFTNINDGGYAALQIGRAVDDVEIGYNLFDKIWAHDTIRIEGTSANDVEIGYNEINNMIASVSRSAIRIDAAGERNRVYLNSLFQDLADATLPGHADNHWAIYNSANAASADAEVGWEIFLNEIDGFGGRDRSQAPIVHNARGKLPVWGNTFGTNTRGGVTTDVEHSAFWFLWNVGDSVSNHTVQTFRAENVVLDGTNATFTAVQPAPLIGNNAATAPVTLHVYWTAADNAEVYLGEITGVTAGQSVSIPATQTAGFIRLQTVDANGNYSQYSSLDPDAPSVVPAAPAVTDTTQTSASGTGTPDAELIVRDPATGDEFGPVVVDAEGNWTVPGLACGTDYVAVQIVGGVESDETPFATDPCVVDAPVITAVGGEEAEGAGLPGALLEIRDAEGNVVVSTTVGEQGEWSVAGLKCGTAYTAVQIVEEVESEAVSFTTAACATPGTPDEPLSNTGSGDMGGLAVGALLLLVLGGAALLLTRRRTA